MKQEMFATFAGGGSLFGEGYPDNLRGAFRRSSEVVEWVPAPGYPQFAPGDDCFAVVAQNSHVVVVVSQDNHHDAAQTVWIIRRSEEGKPAPEWRRLGCHSPNSALGEFPLRQFTINPQGVIVGYEYRYHDGTRGVQELFFSF